MLLKISFFVFFIIVLNYWVFFEEGLSTDERRCRMLLVEQNHSMWALHCTKK